MRKGKKIAAPDDTQFKLFGGMPDGANGRLLKTAVNSGRRFITGEARAIYLGATRLEDYLKQAGQVAAFTVARLLDEQDWLPFEARYAPTGRAPYAPRLMLGLILYGVMQGIHSLRELEQMARLDLGCMWVTGGIAPDHANIGRFIVLHEESLTNEFFESLTRSILQASNSKSARLAGDGTVIEAACSYYNLLKLEAVKARAEAADTKLTNNPDDPAAQQEQQASAQCLAIFEERQQARRRKMNVPRFDGLGDAFERNSAVRLILQRLRLDAAENGGSALFVAIGVGFLPDQVFVAAAAMSHQGRQIALRTAAEKQRTLETETFSHQCLQAIDSGVVAIDVVAHFRCGHGGTHARRGARYRITA